VVVKIISRNLINNIVGYISPHPFEKTPPEENEFPRGKL
jgi:ribosomal protein S17E